MQLLLARGSEDMGPIGHETVHDETWKDNFDVGFCEC
jgi:hypothetical protein